MPCISSIKTKLTEGGRIAIALKDVGYKVMLDDADIIGEKGENRILFRRGSDGAYTALGYTEELGSISKKYAEIGLRDWARKRGYSVVENDGTKMTLVNRRNG